MSLFMQKHAIESNSPLKKGRKLHKRSKDEVRKPSTRRICRVEELEKREYLAADPISVGVVYTEQYSENLGDKFYVAWVGGEEGCTTLDSLIVNLDKNLNGTMDDGEAYFDTGSSGLGVYSSLPFTLIEKTEDIGYSYEVEDGGMTLSISFTNFHAGDTFVFAIDLDEFQPSEALTSTNNAQVEGGEMGGSKVNGIDGSHVSAVFTSDHYQTEEWAGMFVDSYDEEYKRSEALSEGYDRAFLPFDLDDNNEGISQAGIYEDLDLTPKPIVISGYVYADYDVDCNYDRGEDSPLANVEVTLLGEDGDKWTTKTDVNGYYEFNDESLLPGKYRIVSQSDVVSPEGWHYADFCAHGGEYGEKIDPLEIDVDGMQGGDVAPDNNFAKVLPASIEGYVFEDRNNADGKNDGESWDGVRYPATIELYRIERDASGAPTYTLMETQTVDPEGHYRFELDCSYNAEGALRKLPGRTYQIREVFDSPDYTDGKDYIGSLGGKVQNDLFDEVFVGYDQHGVHYDFGELKLGSIAGNVYEDRNDNGLFEANEAAIAGVTVELYQWNGASYVKIDETKTEKDGSYRFDDLDINCEYAVKELQPAEYDDGKDTIGSLGGDVAQDYFSNIEIGWDQHGVEYNFGELKLGSIAGNVYEDRNDNGVFEDSEAGIEDVVVELYQWDGTDYVKIRETKTDENGAYVFDKLDINKEYAVREKQPEAYSDGKDTIGSLGGQVSDDYMESIDVQWDDHGVEYNFGELKLGSISGYVYHDPNDNGIKEEGEKGIADVTVELYRLDGDNYVKINETQTDSVGFYKFDSLDINQTYAVKELQPEGWRDGKDTVGTLGGEVAEDDYLDSISVLWDQHGEQYNFGELLPFGSLSGHVYEDDNDNGVREAGEKGIENVDVKLYVVNPDGTAALVATQLTDQDGFYKFDNLEPDRTYIVRETQPTAYFDGKEAIGTIFGEPVGRQVQNDEMIDIDLPAGGEGINYDFGELRPASISGFVYVDANKNGVKDPGEAGIPSTQVKLYVLNDKGEYEYTDRTATTDALGYYIFKDLEPGRVYRVVETQPSGYKDGLDSVGSLGGEAGNDVISTIKVMPGDEGTDYNFGEIVNPDDPYKPEPTPPSRVYVPNNLWAPSPTNFPYIYYQPTIPGSMTTLYGGGGGVPDTYSWRLNVLNDTNPRSFDGLTDQIAYYRPGLNADPDMASAKMMSVSNSQNGYIDGELTRYYWDGATSETIRIRSPKGKFIAGDWEGSGHDRLGIFKDGEWYLDTNGDGVVDENDDNGLVSFTPELVAYMGKTGDQPVVGDWDRDGKDDIGVFGPQIASDPVSLRSEPGLPSDMNFKQVSRAKNATPDAKDFEQFGDIPVRKAMKPEATANVRGDLVDHVFNYGGEGDVAVTGDWNGDGFTEFGYYRNGEWYLNVSGNGLRDQNEVHVSGFGGANSIPVVGDWNGDGIDDIGVFEDGYWKLDVNGDRRFDEGVDKIVRFGQAGDQPIVGDWNGDGIDELSVYHETDRYDGSTDPTSAENESLDFDSDLATL